MTYLETPSVDKAIDFSGRIIVNKKLEGIWLGDILAEFKILSLHFPAGTPRATRNLRQYNRYPGRGVKLTTNVSLVR
jgi:hypothetical protein